MVLYNRTRICSLIDKNVAIGYFAMYKNCVARKAIVQYHVKCFYHIAIWYHDNPALSHNMPDISFQSVVACQYFSYVC